MALVSFCLSWATGLATGLGYRRDSSSRAGATATGATVGTALREEKSDRLGSNVFLQ